MNPKLKQSLLQFPVFLIVVPLGLCAVALMICWALVASLIPFWIHAQMCLWWGKVIASLVGGFLVQGYSDPRSVSIPHYFIVGMLAWGLLLWLLSWLTVPLFLPILFQ